MCSSSSGELKRAIEITHVINPHLFWFIYKNKPNPEVAVIEEALHNYARENVDEINASGKFANESVVAVHLFSENKWIRATVDIQTEPVTNDSEIVVWAIDYGYPIKTTAESVLGLDNDLKKKCIETPSNVIKGGIYGIVPASMKMSISNQLHMLIKQKWDPEATKHLEEMRASRGVGLYFEEKTQINGHFFGNLLLYNKTSYKERPVAEILCKDALKLATVTTNFERDLARCETIKIKRWLDSAGKMKCIENTKPQTELSGASSSTLSSPEICKKSTVKLIDQHKLVHRFTRMQILAAAEERNRASKKIVENGTPTPDKSLQPQPSTSKLSVRATLKSMDSKLPSTSIEEKSETHQLTSNMNRLSLAQTDEPGLVSKIKRTPVFLRNNEEEPYESILQANFTDLTHKGLKNMNITETYAIQGYAWPNLLRGNSLVLVNSQGSGKTFAYLPVICSTVQRKHDEAMKTRDQRKKSRLGLGVMAIIVCLSPVVPLIAGECRKILQMRQFECHVIEGVGTRDAKRVTIKLYNGGNILVTTAPCLFELLKTSKHIINIEKLKCIAFENLDYIMNKHPVICKDIIKEMCYRKSYNGDVRQFIATARTWKPHLLKFMNEQLIADAVLIIGNYLEAAFAAGVELNIQLCLEEEKLKELYGRIQSKLKIKEERIMVLCNEMAEAERVVQYLESKHIESMLVTETSSNHSKRKTEIFWNNIQGVLVCTDEHLDGTQIRNAQHIIHYSVHPEKYNLFLNRFSAFLDFTADKDNTNKATSTLFIDEKNFRQLPKLVDLLTRDGQAIPPNLLELSQRARIANRKEKAEKEKYHSICNMLFMHGTNNHEAKCEYRHLILPHDVLNDGENEIKSGLRFNVLDVVSPTEYIVRPIIHADIVDSKGHFGKWDTVNKSNEYDQLNLELQIHYKNAANQKILHTLELGQKCVCARRGVYYRAEIMQIIEKRNIIDADKYKIRLIDTGEIEQVQAHELYTLDDKFDTIPRQAYHLHLTSIIPADKEEEWDPNVTVKIRDHLMKMVRTENDLIFEANVVFTLRNTIVVDIMRLINVKDIIVKCYIKSFLRNGSHGEPSKSSMEKVIEMVKAEGVKVRTKPALRDVAEINAVLSPSEPEVLPSTSFNDSASEKSSQYDSGEKWVSPWKSQHKKVHISQFDSPSCLYVVNTSKKVDDLYKAIHNYAIENDLYSESLDKSMQDIDVDKYCLVKLEDGFNRAKILNLFFEIETGASMAEVFLVDVGLVKKVDWTIQCYDIPDEIIQMLPFQAIWCNMVGIRSSETNDDGLPIWSEEQCDQIYNAIDEYGSNLVLHTVLTDKSVQSNIPDIKIARHDIVLLSMNGTEQINIHKMLVDRKLVEIDENTKHILDNIPKLFDDDDYGSDWDVEFDPNNSYEKVSGPEQTPAQTPPNDNEFNLFERLLEDEDGENDVNDFFLELGKQLGIIANPINDGENSSELQRADAPNEIRDPLKQSASQNSHDKLTDDEKSEDSTMKHDSDHSFEELTLDAMNDHHLEYIYKRPRVNWWQSSEIVILKISAQDDSVKYKLKVTADQLIYSSIENNEPTVAVIPLFGCVDPANTKHYVRGVNVVVRLRKLCPAKWPRLRATAEKCIWIIQNVEAFKDENFYLTGTNQFTKGKPSMDSDDEENEEVHIKDNPFEDDDSFED